MDDRQQPLATRRTLWIAAALTVIFVVLLRFEARPWWCKYGLGFWTGAATHCTSQHFLDPYAFTHVLHGILLYWALRPFANRVSLPWRVAAMLGIEIAWEILENSPWVIARYRQGTASLDYTGDSILNAMGDLLACVVGVVFAARLPWQASIAFVLAVELVLLFTISDNLTLNVLMLLWPIEAIKQWQLSGNSFGCFDSLDF